jgi:hypothetical protein
MSSSVLAALLGWLIALAIFLGFIAGLRYIDHRERMAMIARGLDPYRLRRRRRGTGLLRAGLIVGMVGLALTIGLYPLGYILPAVVTATPLHVGPWLLPGLIPLGVGAALVISYYLGQDSRPPDDDNPTKQEQYRNVTENGHHESRPPSSLL